MIPVTELRNGTVFEDEAHGKEPFIVVRYEHIKMARGGAVVKVKIKGLKSGVVKEASYKSNDRVADADVSRQSLQYLYTSDNVLYFMNDETFEQLEVSADIIDSKKLGFLKGGEKIMTIVYEGSIIDLELPKSVTLKVEYAEPGYKGDSATSPLKPARLETGAEVMVPLFVKEGDVIKINTESGGYLGKA